MTQQQKPTEYEQAWNEEEGKGAPEDKDTDTPLVDAVRKADAAVESEDDDEGDPYVKAHEDMDAEEAAAAKRAQDPEGDRDNDNDGAAPEGDAASKGSKA